MRDPERRRLTPGRILAGLLVLAVIAAWLVLGFDARQTAAVAQGRRLLLDGDYAGAAATFERVRSWSRVGAQAHAGLTVARIAGGDSGAPTAVGAFDARATMDAAGIPLLPLLDFAMRHRRYGAAIALGRLAAEGGDPTGLAYRAAARVEQGQDDEARALLDAHPEFFRIPGLGSEVAKVLALRADGPVVVVRDREGRLLGRVDEAGQFQAVDGVPAEWVPPLAVRTLRPGGSAGARLTLDLDLSRLAANSLGGRRGSVVLIDPATGAVRVALSDPATFALGGTPAFEQQREPASIQKLVTTVATLRTGLDPDAEIARMTCAGSEHYGTGTLWCSYPGGKLAGLGHALAISCNVAFANLGTRIGRAAVVDELRRFGFDGDSPGAGHVLKPQGDERQLADLSVGLEATEITPAHAARLAAVFGAGGNMPGVFLVAAEDGAMGMSPHPLAPPPTHRVIEAAWVPVLRAAMAGVTGPGGTAESVAPSTFPVAMKTGTAATPRLGYHVNYIGVGPLPDPSVAFCLRVTNQGSSASVNASAREALRSLLAGLGAGRTAPSAVARPPGPRVSSCRVPVFRLDERLVFPPPELAEDGLLAVGGDLRPERLLTAYSQGIFPWYEDGLPILWHSPDPRMVLRADELHVSRSLAKTMRRRPYQITLDSAFRDVVEACASMDRPGQEGTWITADMIRAYEILHRLGFAHSVEAWRGDELVGGLYGVSLGSVFFGESMFSRAADASKVAFVTLVRDLARRGIGLIDCQVHTPHLERFGAAQWPRERFLAALATALRNPTRKGKWRLSAPVMTASPQA